MTPKDIIDRVFMILFNRPATPEQVALCMELMNDIIKEMETNGG